MRDEPYVPMSWEEFLERYLKDHEEFTFKYHNYVINLLYAPKGEGFAYYIHEYVAKQSFFQFLKNRNKWLETNTYNSPEELLEHFRIEGKRFEEIWDELDWK